MVWINAKEKLPDSGSRVLAWLEGAKEHSGMLWHREGYAFMVRHDNSKHTVKDEWAESYYDRALEDLSASYLEITHWMYLPAKPTLDK